MTQEQKQRYARYAALPMALLAVGGLYFGARAVADRQFSAAFRSASEYTAEQREGLWNYNSLTAREQMLYDVLAEAMEPQEEETARVLFLPTAEEFSAAFDAVLLDHPLYCDLIREECALVAGENSAYVTLSYLSDGEIRRQQLKQAAERFAQDAQSMTDTAFALYLHDSIVQRCQYSDGATEQTTAYDAWFGSVTDGFGYALLYALFCREAEIDCAVVRGTVTGGDETGEHAWNVLTLDGVTGCTDVMWNDSETQTEHRLPFHGYYFLSAAEIGADHTPTAGIVFPSDDNTENYYEMQELCITDAAQTDAFLAELLTDARSVGGDTVELWVDPALGITDYALEQALTRAIDTANAQALSAPQLRQVHRVYRSSVGGGGMTVLLFYEENDEQPGET